MTRFNDETVLVTGGAKGMGKLVARRAIEHGAGRIILWDIDESALMATAEELRAMERTTTTVTTDTIDVSDVGGIDVGARNVLAKHGPVGILFNNAGIVVGKPFEAHSSGDIERSIRVNLLAAMHCTRAFLPGMIERKQGHIVNIASAVGFTPHPRMSVYAASKWAMLGWSESLRIELESMHEGLRVTTVCPSYVDTGMFDGARAPWLTPLLEPNAVVDRVFRAVESDRILVRIPAIVNLLPVLRGLLPARWFDRLIGRGFRIYSSMDRFVGRPGKP